MNISIVEKNQISEVTIALTKALVERIKGQPEKRQAMGEATLLLLNGRARVAETVFGWSRHTVTLGLKEIKTGIVYPRSDAKCKPRTEEKYPKMLEDIHTIMTPESQAQASLRTDYAYTNMTARAVYNALHKLGWKNELPCIRTVSEILNRNGYKLRHVEKSQVKKK